MTNPNSDYSTIADTSRPQPVRLAAFLATLAQAVLAVVTFLMKLDPALVAALLGVIGAGQLGGFLFVQQHVTPVSSPALRRDGQLVPLVAKRRSDGMSRDKGHGEA